MDWLKHAAVIDFESLKVTSRSVGGPLGHPPEPVGLALKPSPGKPSRYYAWGHAHGGNWSSWGEARRALGEVVESGRPILTHNGAQFDIEMAAERLGIAIPWGQVHDTLPMLFLRDPRAETFSLKPSSERILGLPPEERDEVIRWLVDNQPIPGERLSDKPKSDHYAGYYIAHAPAAMVGRYACGDTDRTHLLAAHVYPELARRGMLDAYERERRLWPIINGMERRGVRVDEERLGEDVGRYQAVLARLDEWVRRTLRRPSMNVDSGEELVEAMLAAGKADLALLGVTEKSKVPQTNKDAIERGVTDLQLKAVLKYRGALCTCLRTFMEPWLAMASASGGLIYTSWNSTRQDRGAKGVMGARTGRFSSTPNFQNIPLEFQLLFLEQARAWLAENPDHEDHQKVAEASAKMPSWPFELLPLPKVRGYIVPLHKGWLLLCRDYSQQELRVMAHFENDLLKDAYLRDPWLDIHELARTMINERMGRQYPRKPIKTLGFGVAYGMGAQALADMTGWAYTEAKEVKACYLDLIPGVKELYREAKERAKAGEPIRTWGGREYYCEPPRYMEGRLQHYDYKLPNVLIQGSSADCTKESMCRIEENLPRGLELALHMQVHDELVASAPAEQLREGMEHMRLYMENDPTRPGHGRGPEFDVPMLSEGEAGTDWWDGLSDYDKKGRIVWTEAAVA